MGSIPSRPTNMSSKRQELEKELKEHYRNADRHFKEVLQYLQAAYHVAHDLQKWETNSTIEALLLQIRETIRSETFVMDTSLKMIKTQLNDVLGVELGVEDYEGESED